ncbi:MAG: hypothetical protein R3E31_07990 [Chloroflexota bacterium]
MPSTVFCPFDPWVQNPAVPKRFAHQGGGGIAKSPSHDCYNSNVSPIVPNTPKMKLKVQVTIGQ